MKPVTYLNDASEFELWRDSGVKELIVAVKNFSRRGTLEWNEALELTSVAHGMGFSVSFEWDALMEQSRFTTLASILMRHSFPFDAVRVRDAGAIHWAYHHMSCPLHLLLEAGHHNLLSLVSWQERLGPRFERAVLSPELPLATLLSWKTQLAFELEIMALGPLLLFHSPRPLLSGLFGPESDDEVIGTGSSEESPHRGFPIHENDHGTLMFHPKDLCLLDRWQEIIQSGIEHVRLDCRQQPGSATSAALAAFLQKPTNENLEKLKNVWNREWMRGYWQVNKSDVLFPKLKNPHLGFHMRACGEVKEIKREGWMAVAVSGAGIRLGQKLKVVNPHGESKELQLCWLKDVNFQEVNARGEGEFAIIPWVAGMPVKSRLFSLDS